MNSHLQRLRQNIAAAIEYGKTPSGSLVIAVVGLVLAIYATWFNDRTPGIGYALSFERSVMTEYAIGENISLSIDGRTVDVERAPLAVLFVRLWNCGDTTFRPPDFDPKWPLGIKISGGSVLKAKVDFTSNDYLRGTLTATLLSDRSITVPPAILEPKDSFVIKAIVQKDSPSARLVVRPIGKLAGITSYEEFYPRTAGDPEFVIDYRSVPKTRWIFFGGISIIIFLAFANMLNQWIRKRHSRNGVLGQ